MNNLSIVAPMLLEILLFKSTVVVNDNEPYGHINVNSKLSSWEFGKSLVNELSNN